MNIALTILLMALVTYFIRMLPMVVFRKKIENRFIQSFLYYVPYACLTAMTIPAILYATGSIYSAAVGLGVALILGYRRHSLPAVALWACVAVFVAERIIH
ncbi:MAG: AzlD domain-containing protein [Lachnospiraceae bacterium]|nr:AzlD domain-containing protein [Lachnospiraceae bacterium]